MRWTSNSTGMNYKLIAVQAGDTIKYESTVNEINRVGGAVFGFQREDFPNDAITSVRAKLVHDWILTLAKQAMNNDQRNSLLTAFCEQITPLALWPAVSKILTDSGIPMRADLQEFFQRRFHHLVSLHAQKLFAGHHYFHAVFEVCKAYNKLVKEKARSDRDGEDLMFAAWGWQNGVLKVTACATETDKNIQDGIKFLSAGMMRAVRNPTAHEPAIDKDECLDMLSFLSFLFKQLDKAQYYKSP